MNITIAGEKYTLDKKLGSGMFSTVYEVDNGVLILTSGDITKDLYTQLEGKHIPELKRLGDIQINNQWYNAYFSKKYTPFEEHSDYTKLVILFREYWDNMTFYECQDVIRMRMENIIKIIQKSLPSIGKALYKMWSLLSEYSCFVFDMKADNFMCDDNGQLILIDPFCEIVP